MILQTPHPTSTLPKDVLDSQTREQQFDRKHGKNNTAASFSKLKQELDQTENTAVIEPYRDNIFSQTTSAVKQDFISDQNDALYFNINSDNSGFDIGSNIISEDKVSEAERKARQHSIGFDTQTPESLSTTFDKNNNQFNHSSLSTELENSLDIDGAVEGDPVDFHNADDNINTASELGIKTKTAVTALTSQAEQKQTAQISLLDINTESESQLSGELPVLGEDGDNTQPPVNTSLTQQSGSLTANLAVGNTLAHAAGSTINNISVASYTYHEDDQSFELVLDPPELGKIKITFSNEETGTLIATISGERSQTENILRQNSQLLLDFLRDRGLTEANIEFSDWGNNQYQNNNRDDQNSKPANSVVLNDTTKTTRPAIPQLHTELTLTGIAGLDVRL